MPVRSRLCIPCALLFTLSAAAQTGPVVEEPLTWPHTVPTALCAAPAANFTNSMPAAISATGTPTVISHIVVSGVGTAIWDVDVLTSITHTDSGQLTITLRSPKSTTVTLSSRNGGTRNDLFNGTVWDDQAGASGGRIVSRLNYATVLPAGVQTPLSPEEPLGAFRGEDPNARGH